MYSYEEIIEIVNNASRFGKAKGVEVTELALKTLQTGMDGIPYIHVAGTNGKGSTCAYLTSILMQKYKKVGTFVSPHLVDFEERIMINNHYIPKEKVTEYGNLLVSTSFPLELTMFDYCLLMAVLYFRDEGCDMVIVETGLGGTYDSTNALGNPILTIITKIGFDHVAILGNSLGQIAREKAGILRKGVPFVSQMQEEEAMEALLACAKKIQTGPVHLVTEEVMEEAKAMQPGLIGQFQCENGAGAILAARELGIEEELIAKGIHEAKWMGRMEILSQKPFLMVDGAHNGNGVHALARSLMDLYPGERFHFIMGVMADKDYESMIEELLPLARDFITVTPEYSRGLQAEELASCIGKRGIEAVATENLEDALSTMKEEYKTIVFGSLYFIGEVIAFWNNLKL